MNENIWDQSEYCDILTDIWKHWSEREMKTIRGLIGDLDQPGMTMLDAGCGIGRMSALWRQGEYSGIDGSDEMVRRCKENGLNVERMGVENLRYHPKIYDVVLCHAVLYHSSNAMQILEGLWSITRKRLVVSFNYTWSPFYKGVTPLWYQKDGKGWFLPQNVVPYWMLWRKAKKHIQPASFRIIRKHNEGCPGDHIAYLVMDHDVEIEEKRNGTRSPLIRLIRGIMGFKSS